ncbi:MAG TPA: hypothetical protein VGB63_18240 [Pedobacter sp.]|jgi:hypothetical protein
MRWIAILIINLFIINNAEAQTGRFVNQTEVGLLTGTNQYPNFSARSFNGIRFKGAPIEAGIAVGVDTYSQFTITPVSVSCRWNPLETKSVSPYLSLDMGYGFDWLHHKSEGRSYFGGYLLSPSAGIRVKTTRSNKFVLNLSYKRQEASILTDSNLQFINTPNFKAYDTSEYIFRRLYMSVGLSF